MKLFHKLNGKWSEVTSSSSVEGGVGKDGKSAYEIALDKGFEGSEEEWLNSLKGTNGINGGFSNSIDYNNSQALTLSETTTDDGYRIASAVVEHSGLCYIGCTVSSGCNYIQYLVNGNPVSQVYPNQSSTNSFTFLVTKGDTVWVRINKSYTFNSTGAMIYPYKESNTYSTDETIIGTWIDGKPLYRKIYTAQIINVKEYKIADVKELDIDSCVNIYGSFSIDYSNGKSFRPIAWSSPGSNPTNGVNIGVNGGTYDLMYVYSSATTNSINVIVFMEYTKNSDSV